MKEKLLLLRQAKEAGKLDKGIMVMPQFFIPDISNTEANVLPWTEFKKRLHPIGQVTIPGISTEFIFSPKNIGWSAEDINLYVGAEKQQILEIDDLSDAEGVHWFKLNFTIAMHLLSDRRPETQVNIGFNPQEFSVGHHTVARLHSHIRTIGHELDLNRRRKQSWEEFDWFDKLGFIEPFAVVYHDFLRAFAESGQFGKHLIDGPELELGYSTMTLQSDSELPNLFPAIKNMYHEMSKEYDCLEEVFTDRQIDLVSDRYIPRPKEERFSRLNSYLDKRRNWLSEISIEILKYLAQDIQIAQPRIEPRKISNSAMAYITRGLAGAMTLSFSHDDQDRVRFDFLPRVITTTGVTKTISGKGIATVIAKEKTPATDYERDIAEQYQQDIETILKNEYSDFYRSFR